MTRTTPYLIAAWILNLGAVAVWAWLNIWFVVLPLAILAVTAVPLWIGNILADRIEDHEHRRR